MLYVNDEQNKHCAEQSRPENAVLSQVKHCFLWYWHNLAEVSTSFPTSSLSVPFCTDSLWHTVTVASIASFPYIQVFFPVSYPICSQEQTRGLIFKGLAVAVSVPAGTAQGGVRLAEPLGVSDDDGSMGELPPLSQWEVC